MFKWVQIQLYILQINSTSAPAAKQVPPVTLVHCHTKNSTCHASYSIHQVIDIINHVKLSATHALPLTVKKQPSSSLPDEHCSPSVHSQRHWHWRPPPWPP